MKLPSPQEDFASVHELLAGVEAFMHSDGHIYIYIDASTLPLADLVFEPMLPVGSSMLPVRSSTLPVGSSCWILLLAGLLAGCRLVSSSCISSTAAGSPLRPNAETKLYGVLCD